VDGNSRSEPVCHVEAEIVCVIPQRLFLGNASAAMDPNIIRHHRITNIISVMDDPEFELFHQETSQSIIPIWDAIDEPIENYFVSSYQMILNAAPRSRFLIHCHMGLSRSVTLTISFLMIHYRWTYDNACRHVKELRPSMRPNNGFVEALKLLEFLLFHPCAALTLSYVS
jgi:protein-tyrosine phosphatase